MPAEVGHQRATRCRSRAFSIEVGHRLDADGHAAVGRHASSVVRTASGHVGVAGRASAATLGSARSRSTSGRRARLRARVQAARGVGVPRPGDRRSLPRARAASTRQRAATSRRRGTRSRARASSSAMVGAAVGGKGFERARRPGRRRRRRATAALGGRIARGRRRHALRPRRARRPRCRSRSCRRRRARARGMAGRVHVRPRRPARDRVPARRTPSDRGDRVDGDGRCGSTCATRRTSRSRGR